MKKYLAAAGLALTLVMVSCGSRPGGPDLASEARQEAEKYWDSALTKCGDSYYGIRIGEGAPEGALYQFKEPQINFKEQNVPDAERLNGLEYAAISTVTYKAFRQNWRGKWDAWRQPWTFGGVSTALSQRVEKRGGKWSIGINPERPPKHWQKISCSEVPQ
jgi:hypothetical protein